MEKITIIGAGRVGEATAQLLAIGELAREVVLIDVREGAAQGAALDIQESATLFGFDTRLKGGESSELMADSDLVVITAGVPRKPGMSRSDVLDINLKITESLVDDVVRYAPNALLLLVSNPVDVMTFRAWQRSGWGRNRVFGLSGALDAARMAAFVAMESGYSAQSVSAMVLGGHGDAMVPLKSYTCINGIPIGELLDSETIDRIMERTRQGGAEILALKKNSSAYNAPAAAIVRMVDAIALNRCSIIPSVAVLEGEYGQQEIALGVPVVLGLSGVEQVIELSLTEDEQRALANSAEGVRADLAGL